MLEEVEFVLDIVKRFVIGVMSYGLILLEIYIIFVVVMNWLGGKFNIGNYCKRLFVLDLLFSWFIVIVRVVWVFSEIDL